MREKAIEIYYGKCKNKYDDAIYAWHSFYVKLISSTGEEDGIYSK
jgi:hypothetical protein